MEVRRGSRAVWEGVGQVRVQWTDVEGNESECVSDSSVASVLYS